MSWVEETPPSRNFPKGGWRGCYYTAGKRTRRKTFAHKKAAERWAASEEQKVVEGSRRDPARSRMKWEAWCERWWPSRRLEPGAMRSQVSLRDNHVLPRWGATPLNEITHLDIQTWVNGLTRNLSASSTRQCYYQLSASMKAAVRAGVVDVSPCHAVVLPALPPAPERYLTDDEVGDLFRHFDEPYLTLVELLLGSGLRLGEAVALHRHRVNFTSMTLDVVEKWDLRRRELSAYPKGKRRRTVPLGSHLAGVLRTHLAARPETTSCGFAHAKGSRCFSELVLVGPRGAVIDPHNFTNVKWAEALSLADIGHARPHDLRHTYASRLVTSGLVTIPRLQRLLGHESAQTTERYAHLLDDGYDEVRDALARHDQGASRGADRPTNLDKARQRRAARPGPRRAVR